MLLFHFGAAKGMPTEGGDRKNTIQMRCHFDMKVRAPKPQKINNEQVFLEIRAFIPFRGGEGDALSLIHI